MKTCTKCKIARPLSEFSRDRNLDKDTQENPVILAMGLKNGVRDR